MSDALANPPAALQAAGPRPTWWEWTFAAGVLGVWLVGQVVRERFWLSGVCFFIPTPCVAALLLAAAGWSYRRRHSRRSVATLLAAAAIPVLTVLCVENRWQREAEPTTAPTLRLVHWNVASGNWGWNEVVQALVAEEADVYVLSEVTRDLDLQGLAGDADLKLLRVNGVIVAARGGLELVESFKLGWGGYAGRVRWDRPEGPVTLLIADLPSNPWLSREPLLARFRAAARHTRPDLIVGDFNTPRRSAGLQGLDGYRHAYDAAGAGWSATWPFPLPLLSLDQCLVGPRIRPVRYDLATHRCSDHRLQRLEFLIE